MKVFIVYIFILLVGFTSVGYSSIINIGRCTMSEKKKVRILTIDGGGIRGIIPIKILAAIESKLGKGRSITDYFELMSGTSAGGILVLMLNIPDQDGNPKYKAEDAYKIYKEMGKSVFYRSMYQIVKSGDGWIGDKYCSDNLNKILIRIFDNYSLTESVKDIIISSYDLLSERNYFFKRNRAHDSMDRQFYMRDIALATSAAPTYFKPADIKDIHGINKYLMVDGGVSVNNPAMSTLIYAYQQYGENADYIVISLGTGSTKLAEGSKLEFSKMNVNNAGKLGWASNIINLLMDSVNDVTDYEIKELLPNSQYFRLQVTIDPQHSSLDDATDENIDALEQYADHFIRANDDLLNSIVEVLK